MDSDDDIPAGGRDEKRAHHNALERKRRDHIKESFSILRDQIPNLNGEKASRAAILNTARDYIHQMRGTNHTMEAEVDEMRKQNDLMAEQIRLLEAAIKQQNPNAALD
eukprot:comp24234_c0_seq2/m.44724 comp24234_c0_seq2/g.44724  ORF comp24234_c0_seq2/g.44724 comp24234_c0_seq2/m.44724 type:complete len:108 (-) comp24234_c0_seq2:652-975(-)